MIWTQKNILVLSVMRGLGFEPRKALSHRISHITGTEFLIT